RYIAKALTIDNENVDYLLFFGDIYRAQHKYYRAEDKYTTAYLKAPLDPRCIQRLLDIYLILEKYHKALNTGAYLYTIYKSKGVVYLNKGLVYQEQGKDLLAEKFYKKAIREKLIIKPAGDEHSRQCFDPYLSLADLYFKNKNFQDAAAAYSELLDILRQNSTAGRKSYPARELFVFNRYKRIGDLSAYLEKKIKSARFYHHFDAFMDTYFSLDDKFWAKRRLQRRAREILSLGYDNAETFYVKSLLAYITSSNTEKAFNYADKAVARNKKFIGAYLIKGDIFTDQAEYREAYKVYKKAEFYAPGNSYVLGKLINLFRKSGDKFMEKVYIKRYLKLPAATEKTRYSFYLAQNYYYTGQYLKAYETVHPFDLRKFARLRLKRDLQYAFRGFSSRTGLENVYYFTSINKENNSYVFYGLVKSYYKLGKYKKIVSMYRSFLQKNDYYPVYILEHIYELYQKMNESSHSESKSAAAALKKLISFYFSSPFKLKMIVKTKLGLVPRSRTISGRMSLKALSEYTEFILLTGKHRDDIYFYLQKIITLQNKKLAYLNKHKASLTQKKEMKAAGENAFSANKNSYEKKKEEIRLTKIKYFNKYFYLRINDIMQSFNDADYWAMQQQIDNLEKTFKAEINTKDSFFHLDLVYLKRLLQFLKKMQIAANLRYDKQKEEIEEKLDQIYEEFYDKNYFYTFLSDYYMDTPQKHKAFQIARRGTYLFPTESKNYYLLARYFKSINNPRSGIKYIKKAIKLDKYKIDYYHLYSSLLIMLDKNKLAFKVLEHARQVLAGTYQTVLGKGNLYFKTSQYSKALLVFKSLIEQDEFNPAAYHNAGLACIKLKKYKEGQRYFQKASFYGLDNILTKYYLAKIKYYLGEFKEAEAMINEVIAVKDNNPYYFYARGRIYEKLMAAGSIKKYHDNRDIALRSYIRGLQKSRFYQDVNNWCRERIDLLKQNYFIKQSYRLEASVCRPTTVYYKDKNFYGIIALANAKLELFNLTSLEKKWSAVLDS
ncbi:MAG TPA: hypothetical protein VKS21_07130, partial [Spirochaetota bacterium]|nr:hypothetical protein [Spirochaetota bacterium]